MSPIVGIDLGTTNSAIGVWQAGKVRLIPNSLGHVLTPSAVSLDDEGEVLVGLAARERQSSHPDRTATAFKRYMGAPKKLRLGGRDFSPEELSSLVLARLKADAEAWLGEPVSEAVIAVPAYFNDKQRKATRRAGELAGLTVGRLINEPTAAALAYGIADRDRETRFLVFDLGGGTFDVSILEIFEGVLEVRASAGDNRLGGEDFNDVLVQRMRARFGADWGADRYDKILEQRVRAAAERARRALSQGDESVMSVVWKNRSWELPICTAEFEEWVEPLLNRLRGPVLRALQDGRLPISNMDEVVLVGGSSRMPVVRRAVTRMFGRFPLTSVDPEEAVVRGAAIQAGLKARDSTLAEVVLTDVCPYSLGVDVTEQLPGGAMRAGVFCPIIERNTTVPASRVKSFYTLSDRQARIDLKVFQGEARNAADNILLGTLAIAVPPGPAGAVSIDVRFTYDINGLLEVDVHVPISGRREQLVIADPDVTVSEDFAARRAVLAALKKHPRDQDANRAATARAERIYEDSIGDRRAYIGDLIRQFEAALESQDDKVVKAARLQFLAVMDELEGATYL